MGMRIVFWEVDAQRDFMLPGGKLYVPGAEKIVPNIQHLVRTAIESRTLLVSSACAHSENDAEFQTFPPHCIKGTPGAEVIPEGMAPRHFTVTNDPAAPLPPSVLDSLQIVIEKQMLDVFSNPRTPLLVDLLGPDAAFVVFGVVTEYCVRCASDGLLERGRKVYVVRDAIETLDANLGRATLDHLVSRGAHIITTAEAVALVR
jgi:nicotinamidase/pyrazinamidase